MGEDSQPRSHSDGEADRRTDSVSSAVLISSHQEAMKVKELSQATVSLGRAPAPLQPKPPGRELFFLKSPNLNESSTINKKVKGTVDSGR